MVQFKAWTAPLKENGQYLMGTSVAKEYSVVSKGNSDATVKSGPLLDYAITGFFQIKAENLEAVQKIAKTCPSLAHDKIEIYSMENG